MVFYFHLNCIFKALQVCEQHRRYEEMVFLLGMYIQRVLIMSLFQVPF